MFHRSSLAVVISAVSIAAVGGCGSDTVVPEDPLPVGLVGGWGGAAGATPAGSGGGTTFGGSGSGTAGAGGRVNVGGTAGSGGRTNAGGSAGTGGKVNTGGSSGSGSGGSGATASGGTDGSDASVGATDGGDAGTSPTGDASGVGDASAVGDAGGAGTITGHCGTFPKISDLASTGPLANVGVIEGPNCAIYRPTTPGQGGVRHPVIVWGNGTGGPSFVYEAAFKYWASHGFIVAAGNSLSGQGSGVEMLGCLDYVIQQSKTTGSPLLGHVCDRVATSGHSQGGGGALMAARDPRVTVSAPLMPYIAEGFGGFTQASITKQTGPMLLLSGTADTIAAPDVNQKPVFDTTNVPVFWANLVGGDHVAVATNGLATYREAMLAWYRLHLMDDETFRSKFYGANCGLCTDKAWIVQRRGIQ